MRKALLVLLGLLLVAAPAARAAGPELKTEEQKTLYALGLALAQNLASFTLTPAELEVVKAGLTDGTLVIGWSTRLVVIVTTWPRPWRSMISIARCVM